MSATQLQLWYQTKKGVVELSKTCVLTDGEITTVSAKRLRYVEHLFLPKTEFPVTPNASVRGNVDPCENLRAPRREHREDRRRTFRCAEVSSRPPSRFHECSTFSVDSSESASVRAVRWMLVSACAHNTGVSVCTNMGSTGKWHVSQAA